MYCKLSFAALAIALSFAAPRAQAQSTAFEWRTEQAPPVGTVWHYSKSNRDGSAAWNLDLYVASPTRIDVIKWMEGGSDMVEVAADIDLQRAMPVAMQQFNIGEQGREPRLWANVLAQELRVMIAGGPQFTIPTGETPLHVWGFDLMGLAMLLPHLKQPDQAFELTVLDPNRPGDAGQPFAQSSVRFEPAGEAQLHEVSARKYRISGAVFGEQTGWLWVAKADGRLLRAEHPVPTSTDWTDWKLDAIGAAQMDGNAWEQRKLKISRAAMGDRATASLAAAMHRSYQDGGIQTLLAGIDDWRIASLQQLEQDLQTVAQVLLGQEQTADAVQLLLRISEEFPQSAQAWYHLGEGQVLALQPKAAKRSFQRALKLQPEHPQALQQLAKLK